MLMRNLGIWVQWWADTADPDQDLGYWLGIYAFLAVMAVLFIIVSCWYGRFPDYS